MKPSQSLLTTDLQKSLLMLVCSVFAFAFANHCSAQPIVGKWNQLKIKTFYTAEGAKQNGNHSESEIKMSDIGTGTFVFYSNHTYRQETTTGNSKVKTILGTWSMSGNQLEMQMLAQQEDPRDNPKKGTPPEKTTVNINGDKMEWTTVHPGSDKLISKIVLTFAKNS